MKWFERLMGKIEEEEEIVEEVVEPETESEPEVEEPKPEMIDVEIGGTYLYQIIEREERQRHFELTTHYIEFKYDVIAKFLGHEASFKDSVIFRINEGDEERYGYHRYYYYTKESAYEYLYKLLAEGQEHIMEKITESLKSNINAYIREQKLDQIKKELKEGEKFDLNLTFQMKKPKA